MEIALQKLAEVLEQEISWFEQLVDTSLTLYFKNDGPYHSLFEILPPDLNQNETLYAQLVNRYGLEFEDRLVLILAIVPHVKPQALDVFLIRNNNLNTEFSEFGGYKLNDQPGFYPTLETACFILGGYELVQRFSFMNRFSEKHVLFRKGIIEFDNEVEFDLHQRLKISNEYLSLITTGKRSLPQHSFKFPAKEIFTQLDWDDLIVEEAVVDDLMEIKDWMVYSDMILEDWNLKKNLKAGFRVLFYGPSGTGKTLAATLLGKSTQRPVFRVDLSLVVSKYIGETEKNLARLFDEAEHKDWILFFDEADALFGKRTQTKGANDRYANQEVAYLLQRIEDFSGLVILATNLQTNVDDAFTRRFQSMIHFPKPGVKQRELLWKRLLLSHFEVEADFGFEDLAMRFELTGGEMINVVRLCAIRAARRDDQKIGMADLVSGIKREYSKLNRTI